ncbi:MAG: hypothetical protein WCA38_12945, partial [Candidatus Acidiferrales bacterium]
MRQNLSCAFASLLIVSAACVIPLDVFSSNAQESVLLSTMQQELKRATASLSKTDPAPYYLSYAVTDSNGTAVIASNGSVVFSTSMNRRQADVMMRVGTIALDNTHNQSRGSGIASGMLPLNDDSNAIARVLWQLTDREYEQASAAFLKVKTSNAVQSEEDDKSPDFSKESPQDHLDASQLHDGFSQKTWEDRTRTISAGFLKYPEVYESFVSFTVAADRSYLATSEGTALIRPSAVARLVIQAQTRADDGMELMRVESFEAGSA